MAGGNPKLERDTLSGPLPGLSQPQSTFRAGGGGSLRSGDTRRGAGEERLGVARDSLGEEPRAGLR